MTLFLIRHGESVGNVKPELYQTIKDHNINLTDLGISQAFEAGKNLKELLDPTKSITAIISPYLRTRETWSEMKKSLGDFSIKEEETPLLREQEHKIFANQEEQKEKFDERNQFGHFYYRFKNTESVADVYQRTQIFLNSLMLRKLQGKLSDQIIIVSHAITLHTMQMIIENSIIEHCHEDMKNCEIRVISEDRLF